MKSLIEARCLVCHLVFCCGDCRWKHERASHGLTFDCPICRGNRFLCRPEELSQEFVRHLAAHLPLQCKKCNKLFSRMEDLSEIDRCNTISELFDSNTEDDKEIGFEEKFDSLYEKVNGDGENFEAIVSINSSSKTAIITPLIRKKALVDYETSDTDCESSPAPKAITTPHTRITPRSPSTNAHRAATPHIKKLLLLQRQGALDYNRAPADESSCDDSPQNAKMEAGERKPSTPTVQPPPALRLAQAVSTSTPTQPGSWSLFSDAANDSPLSEIEPNESPAEKEPVPSRSEQKVQPKLRSIMFGTRAKLSSQDSAEKPTVQDSDSLADSSAKLKRVKFADDTVFDPQAKIKRVFKKPRRMLTPGRPQRFATNPRFQALINRFECQAAAARTPRASKDAEKTIENTPPAAEHNVLARAISFKDASPGLDADGQSRDSNELYRTCVESPAPVDNALASFTANLAGTLQTCLSSVVRSADDETEIQFKFVISKRKVSVKRIAENGGLEKLTEFERDVAPDKENIWASVTKAVRNVIWGNRATPYESPASNDTTSSSASKRKFEESESELSPLNHKRHKYEGRIRGRPPLQRARSRGVSGLRTSRSAEQPALMQQMTAGLDDHLNCSF